MDDGRRKLKMKPYADTEEEFDWRDYKHKMEKEIEEDFDFSEEDTRIRTGEDTELPDELEITKTEGDSDEQTKGE